MPGGPHRVVRIIESRSGAPTIEKGGLLLHSSYDPAREAARRAADGIPDGTDLVVVIAPGLWYLVEEAVKKAPSVWVVEEDPEVLAAARRAREPVLNELIASPGLQLILSPGPGIEGWMERLSALDNPEKTSICIIRATPADGEASNDIVRIIEEAVEKTVERILTEKAFEERWIENLIENLRFAPKRGSVIGLGDWLSGRSAVIVAPGPSLEGALPDLSAHREAFALIAVDAALSILEASGIEPDLAVSVDPSEMTVRHFESLTRRYPLAAPLIGSSEAAGMGNPVLHFIQGHPAEIAALGPVPEATFRDIGGSVATAAAALARSFGAKRLVLVGQDMAFAGDRLFSRGSREETERLSETGRFSSMETMARNRFSRRNTRRTRTVSGGEAFTTPALDSYRRWFERFASEEGSPRIVQTSGISARIRGAIFAPPGEVLPGCGGRPEGPPTGPPLAGPEALPRLMGYLSESRAADGKPMSLTKV